MNILMPFLLAWDPMKPIVDAITNFFTMLTDWVVNGVETVVTTVANVIVNTVFISIKSTFEMIWNIISRVFSNIFGRLLTPEFLIILAISAVITLIIFFAPKIRLKKGGK